MTGRGNGTRPFHVSPGSSRKIPQSQGRSGAMERSNIASRVGTKSQARTSGRIKQEASSKHPMVYSSPVVSAQDDCDLGDSQQRSTVSQQTSLVVDATSLLCLIRITAGLFHLILAWRSNHPDYPFRQRGEPPPSLPIHSASPYLRRRPSVPLIRN